MKKRVFALLLIAALCVGLVPASVLARDGTEPGKEAVKEEKETVEEEPDMEELPVNDMPGDDDAQEKDDTLVRLTDSDHEFSRFEEEINPKADEETYGFQIVKKDDLGVVLYGAKFNLYDIYGNIIYFTKSVNDDGTYYNFCEEDMAGAMTEIEAGDVYVGGLTGGSYVLMEIEAPDGYIGADSMMINVGPEEIDEPDSEIQTNTVTPPKTVVAEVTNYAVIDIPVEKIWMNDDTYGHRPESIDVELFANGDSTGKVITLSEKNDWKGTFSELRKYDGEEEIEYTVKESSDESLQYYVPKITYNDDGSIFIVNQLAYFDIDEEIVPEESNRDTWVKSESVGEYNAVEIEMSTYLPVIPMEELLAEDFTMRFHNVLDSELLLDQTETDFTVYIGGKKIPADYYTLTLSEGSGSLQDGCTFHVNVDLTALCQDSVITEEDLLGDTEMMIFFYADLEGTGLNGSYKSTVWYDVYNGDEWQFTSNESVVEVYTYDIEIEKYDSDTEEHLAEAVFGLYEDEDCDGDSAFIRSDAPYTTVSDENGEAQFYGLAAGTYYVKELEAPKGYERSDQILTIVLDEEDEALKDSHVCSVSFANTRLPEEKTKALEGRDISGSKIWDDDEDHSEVRPDSITVNLYRNDEFYDSRTVTESEDWTWTWEDLPKVDDNGEDYIYTINEDEVDGYTPTYYEESFDIKNTYLSEEEGGEYPLNQGPEKGGDVPKTGNTNFFCLWTALCLAGIAGVIAVLRRRKRV